MIPASSGAMAGSFLREYYPLLVESHNRRQLHDTQRKSRLQISLKGDFFNTLSKGVAERHPFKLNKADSALPAVKEPTTHWRDGAPSSR
jgi:hypothetical protein